MPQASLVASPDVLTLRQRLRLTLLLSVVALLAVAFVCYMIGGLIWALWPLALAFITFGFSFGRWDATSFAYFRQDIAAVLKLRSSSADDATPAPAHPITSSASPAEVGVVPASHISTTPAADAPVEPPVDPPAWIAAFAASERSIALNAIVAAVALIVSSPFIFPSRDSAPPLAWASYLLSAALALAALALAGLILVAFTALPEALRARSAPSSQVAVFDAAPGSLRHLSAPLQPAGKHE